MQRNHTGVPIILTSHPSTEGPSPEYNFHAGLSTVRSPLLGKSWLVFSPPRSDMLKHFLHFFCTINYWKQGF